MKMQFRQQLLGTTLFAAVASFSAPALAQEVSDSADATEQPAAQQSEIIVTGSRISRPNLESNSPVVVVSGEAAVQNADITLDTFLNTLPQVNPSGTTTSNNPGNGGQSNINLRGLGTNRNLVLIDGRRPMVSSTAQAVDLNTIPQGLIERMEVLTGGGGAAYGADAVSGVLNIRMKRDFEGLDLRANYSNTIPETDAREYQISGVLGGNFADGRGNLAVAVEYANREPLIKSQRSFAEQASSTTGTPPVGRLIETSSNAFSQAAIDAVFGSYGVAAAQRPTRNGSQIHFNSDGTLFGGGIFNSPLDVSNYRYGVGGPAGANTNFFPDFYSYNFDAINLLVLPLERKSAFMKGHYEIAPAAEVFVQGGYTEYSSAQALAPTPIGTRIYRNAPSGQYASSPLIEGTGYITQNVIPVTNPFIPADLRTLLNSRTGDDPTLAGAGANEAFRMSIRSLATGLRQSDTDNSVLQGLIGLRGDISDSWRYEAYYSYGKTVVDVTATGNVNVQRLQQLLEAPDGGASLCAGGYNPFGIQNISQECVDFIDETGFTSTEYTLKVGQAYVQGDIAQLPAGTLSVVAGVESRKFNYVFDPGALFGPIAGFNTQLPANGTNSFFDIFGEVLVPLVADQPWAKTLELSLGYRSSRSDFNDIQREIDGEAKTSDAYKAELTWAPVNDLRLRASYQRAVRAPNFGELFSGGSSFVQFYDPCSVGTNFRVSNGAAGAAFCSALKVANPDVFVATPGAQGGLGVAGNPDLEPEKADTFTVGAVFEAFGFTGSLDFYKIDIKDAIYAPNPNIYVAACYGYLGNINPNLDPTNKYCGAINRSGSFISSFTVTPALGGDAQGNFLTENSGKISTSGLDFQLAYRLPTDFAGEGSRLNFDLLVNYLINWKQEELPGVVLDYAGTAGYFGQGLGQSFPHWKGNLNIAWNMKPITLSTRLRYIGAMDSRAALQFPGEDFKGTPSVVYVDAALETNWEGMTFRIGVNNLFNKQPPLYAPNFQSGTDPSLFDVIGRRAYVQTRLKF